MTAAVFNLSTFRERDSYLEAVFNTLSQGVMIFDRDGSVKTINRAALKIHGLETIDGLRGELDECGRLFEWLYADGRAMPREQCPVARALKLAHALQLSSSFAA